MKIESLSLGTLTVSKAILNIRGMIGFGIRGSKMIFYGNDQDIHMHIIELFQFLKMRIVIDIFLKNYILSKK